MLPRVTPPVKSLGARLPLVRARALVFNRRQQHDASAGRKNEGEAPVAWNIFRKKKANSEEGTSAEPASDVPGVAAEPPAGAPTVGSFAFDTAPPVPDLASDETESAERDVPAERSTTPVAKGRRTGGARVLGRVAQPVWVPSLRERALVYRLGAEVRGEAGSEEALSLWRAYLELCPEDAEAHFATARHLLGVGRSAAAEEAFAEAWRLDPENGLAAGGLGHCANARGEPAEALHCFEAAVRARPKCVDMLTALGDAQTALGLEDAATATRQRLQVLVSAR